MDVRPLSNIGANQLEASIAWLRSARLQWRDHHSRSLKEALGDSFRLPNGRTAAEVLKDVEALHSDMAALIGELETLERTLPVEPVQPAAENTTEEAA